MERTKGNLKNLKNLKRTFLGQTKKGRNWEAETCFILNNIKKFEQY